MSASFTAPIKTSLKFSANARVRLRLREKEIYTFNLGQRGASKALELVDEGDFQGAVTEITSMIRVKVRTKKGIKGVVAHGLIKRRAEESAPFRE